MSCCNGERAGPPTDRKYKHRGSPTLILCLAVPGLVFFPLAIAAAIMGARYRAKVERGELPQSRAAQLGFLLGVARTLVSIIDIAILLYLLPVLLTPAISEYEDAAMAELRDICSAQSRHFKLTGSYAQSIELLHERGFLEPNPRQPRGYRFELSVHQDVKEFSARAHPEIPGTTGRRHFYIDHSGVLRHSDSPQVNCNSAPVNTGRSRGE